MQSDQVMRHWHGQSFSAPAFMHAILCLSAVQLGVLHPERTEYVALAMHHRIESMSAIQASLRDPKKMADDATIAAVFNLLCVEENISLPSFASVLSKTHLRSDPAQRIAHMNGLRQLIRMRGGLQGLKSHKGLLSFVMRFVTHLHTIFSPSASR